MEDAVKIEYSDKIIRTFRVRIQDKPSYLGLLTTAVGDLSGMFGEIRTVHIGKGYKVRDLDVYVDTEDAFNNIVNEIKKFDGIELLEIKDLVQDVHEGGKIKVVSTVDVSSIDDLSIVYTPGVASICRLIFKHPELAHKYTTINKNVAIVTNGTAILGLGDIGPVAGMPVMEGKALLFNVLAGLNGYPLLIESKSAKDIIETVKHIYLTFGAIKLEDIKAPECFEIEDELDKCLDIPVMHDDQHGTAIVVLSALINIAKYTHTNISEASVGIIGLGAAGSGIQKLLKAYGVKNIYGTDLNQDIIDKFVQRGGIPADYTDIMEKSKIVIATTGCPGLIKPEWVRKGQIILALSNPDPEIDAEAAIDAGAVFAADGKSINNALAFPGVFKGAMKANAKCINNAMKIDAAITIAHFAEEGDLVPNILNKKVHDAVADAVEKAAYMSGVSKNIR